MVASTLKVVVAEVTYHVDDPKLSEGLKATISALAEQTTEAGHPQRIIHRDRINLDRARDRERFATAAGTDPIDLLEVRDRVLDFLAPATPLREDALAEVDPAVQAEALALLDAPDLLDRLEQTIRALGYAGDLTQPLLIYLVFVSRLLMRPMNLVVGGPSAAGKSFVVALVARLFPPSATYALSGMSERLLAYTDADLRHRTLVIGEAAALHHDGIGASLLRSLAWEGHIIYETVESTTEGLKPRRIEKEGPTGFVTTTTKSVEAELETRVLTIHVPDDKQATQEIIKVTAERANGRRPEEPDLRPWLEAQRLLAEEWAHEVTIPYAETLAACFPVDQVRSRRDFTQLLSFIQASALLHQRQRERDEFGRVIASAADYAIVYRLAEPIFGAIVAEGVTPAVRETVIKVAHMTQGAEGITVSLNALANALDLDKSSVSRRVGKALRGGFLVNEEPGKGKSYKLRLGESLPEQRAALPTPEEVFGPLGTNSATRQHQGQDLQQDAEIGSCTDRAREVHQANRAGSEVDGVDEELHRPAQQSFPHDNAKTECDGGEYCTVAPGGRATSFPEVGAEPDYLVDAPEPEEWFDTEPSDMAYGAGEMPMSLADDPWAGSTRERL